MKYITVAELRVNAAENQINSVVIHCDVQSGECSCVVRLAWRNVDHLVIGFQSRKPRTWKSLDRLVEFLRAEGALKTDLVIKFNKE